MKTRLITLLAVLVLASLACQAAASGGSSTQESSSVLFQDDFSDTSSGWDQVNVNEGITDYANGVYRIFVNTANTDIWANPGLNFTDTRIEVDATKVAGDDNNDYGIICRYQDGQNFYFFVISSDGYYGIGKVSAGKQQLIGEDNMPPTDAVTQGNQTNHLRGDCVGSKLTIYVNGEKLAEYDDAEFSSGDVGLLAGSFDNPGTDIHFDNFTVMKP